MATRSVVITLAVVLLTGSCSATTIVIRKTPKDLFVSADSKVIHPTGIPDSRIDKIISLSSDWYFAAAGHLELGSFDVFRTARMCAILRAPKTTSMKEFADSCSAKIALEMFEPLRVLKEQSPELYARHVFNQNLLELAFFGKEQGQLSVYLRNVAHTWISDGFPFAKTRSDCAQRECTGTLALGYFDLFDSIFATAPDYWKGGFGGERACHLVALEIEKHPDAVGWPIKVLHLPVSGLPKWFSHDKNCK